MSQYDRKIPFGSFDESGTYRSEDIENQTFTDKCFDVATALITGTFLNFCKCLPPLQTQVRR